MDILPYMTFSHEVRRLLNGEGKKGKHSLHLFFGECCHPARASVSTGVRSETPGQKTKRTPIRQEDMKMKTYELKMNEMEKVSGGKIRYKEIEKYLTEEDKKEMEELRKRVENS